MKRILSRPATNAACIALFSAFYAVVFLVTSQSAQFQGLLYTGSLAPFWGAWSGFLAAGRHTLIAYAMIAATVLVVALLLSRRRPYDEYHTAILIQCLAVACVLVLAAIAVFFLMILSDPTAALEKFTLFIVVHWVTVVLADLVYVFICRWR